MRFFQCTCGVCAFLASSVLHGVATPPLLPTLTVYYREVPLLVFRLVWCWSGVFCSVYANCADDSSAGSCASLAQGCRCGGFFPISAVFALVLGTSVLAYGILALLLLFLDWLHLWCGLFCYVCLSSAYLYPTVAGLVVLAAGLHFWWSLCVCGVLLRRRSCVFFLSSCWVWGRLLLSLFWCGFCASS